MLLFCADSLSLAIFPIASRSFSKSSTRRKKTGCACARKRAVCFPTCQRCAKQNVRDTHTRTLTGAVVGYCGTHYATS